MLEEKFLQYLKKERNYSNLTIVSYGKSLEEFKDFVGISGEQKDWFAIESGDIRKWIVDMTNKGSANSTVNTRLRGDGSPCPVYVLFYGDSSGGTGGAESLRRGSFFKELEGDGEEKQTKNSPDGG